MASKKNIIGVIPARYASTRFPGKPLVQIKGKPMIVHTYENSKKSKLLNEVLVATDDNRILEAVEKAGGKAVMTPSNLESGTDRIAYCVKDISCDIVVNIQGDEPFIQAEAIDSAIKPLIENDNILVSTLIKKIDKIDDLINRNVNKVIIDKDDYALYFSHSSIPCLRDFADEKEWLKHHVFYKHIGLYVYEIGFLFKFSGLPKSALEKAEKLEQLRILENGYKIKCVKTDYESISVDTPDDLKKII
jgi:3-deoxy-manno-octulosonate cytidylyltransferase (CMP-KDO synthetase)